MVVDGQRGVARSKISEAITKQRSCLKVKGKLSNRGEET